MTPGNTPSPQGRAVRRERPQRTGITLGLRQNLAQFSLLVAVNALVGGMIGQERTVLPLLAGPGLRPRPLHRRPDLHRRLRGRQGRHQLLRRHPVGPLRPQTRPGRRLAHRHPRPAAADLGTSWGWVVAANVLLGINQGLTWSTTVIMKIDLVGPARRGLAMGLNEAAGYGAVAVTALATGYIAANYGLRPGRSSSASPTRRSASACRSWPSAKPAATPAWKPPATPPPTPDAHGGADQPARSSP